MYRVYPVRGFGIPALLCSVLLLLSLRHALAGQPVTWCANGDFDFTRLIPVSQDAPKGFLPAASLLPEIQGDKKLEIKWLPISRGTKIGSTVIGRYKGNEIIKITYLEEETARDIPRARFSYVVFLYKTVESGVTHVRPFYKLSGDLLSSFDYRFLAPKDNPPSLVIEATEAGTGVFSTECEFTFSDQEAILLHRIEAARRAPEKHFDYDPSGRLIKITTVEN